MSGRRLAHAHSVPVSPCESVWSLITVDLSSNLQVTSVAHYLSSGSIVYYRLLVIRSWSLHWSSAVMSDQEGTAVSDAPDHTPHRYTTATPLRMLYPPLMSRVSIRLSTFLPSLPLLSSLPTSVQPLSIHPSAPFSTDPPFRRTTRSCGPQSDLCTECNIHSNTNLADNDLPRSNYISCSYHFSPPKPR